MVGPPKTAKSRRTVHVPSLVTDALARACEASEHGELIFTADRGGPIRRTNWTRRVWRPAVHAAELEPLRFHDLRHSHVALLMDQGEHPRGIADRLGHSGVRTVLDVSGGLFPGADADIADRLLEALSQTDVPRSLHKPRSAEVHDPAKLPKTPSGNAGSG